MRFFPLLLVLLLAVGARAQNRWEGTLTQTQDGLTATAQIAVQAPDHMRVEIARDDAAGIVAQIIVAEGDQTLAWEPATKRLRRARFNVLKKWNHGWGIAALGPANFFFAGAAPGIVTETEGQFARRDRVLFGGGGEDAYYAATKVRAGIYPTRVELTGTPPSKRVDSSAWGTTLLTANVEYANALPVLVKADARGEMSEFRYDVKARADAFPDATWTIPDAREALAEEVDLQAPTAYSNAQDPNDLLNGGVALWRGAGDFSGALARLAAASKIAPTATAPRLAAFELAMQTRQLGGAQAALDSLANLGMDEAELQGRRAGLALARRDWDSAVAALDKALVAAPDSYVLKLARAQALLGKNDVEGARAMWQAVAAAKVPLVAQAEAANLLADSEAPDGKGLLDAALKEAGISMLAKRVLSPGEAAKNQIYALALERAARDDEARVLWEEIEKRAPDDTKNRARAHLMTLAARRGDVSASLAAFERLRDGLASEAERDTATQALFDAWQKAFRRDALASALANRAGATRATDADARLELAYQDAYGTAKDSADAIETGLNRAPDAAFWLGRKAEVLASQASAQLISNNASAARRDQLLAQARDLLQRAIDADKKAGGNGLFYEQQRALIVAQGAARLSKPGGVSDSGRAVRERKMAVEALTDLVGAAPNDPDVLLSAALAWQSFGGDEGAGHTIELANRALLSQPDDGPRHTLILAARQAIAVALARLKQPRESAEQFDLLLLEARDAGEQASIAANYLLVLQSANDAAGAANLMARIAGESWDYSANRAALEALSRRIVASPLLIPVEAQLAQSSNDAAHLAWGFIAQARLARAQAALEVPGAPGSADAELERATRDVNAVRAVLQTAKPVENYLAARVAAWLAEFGNLTPEAALEHLQLAAKIESRAPALRLTLAEALPDDAAKAELRRAAQVLPDNTETARLVSLLALELGEDALAEATSEAAFNAAAREPLTSANDFQRIAFARARIAWVLGQSSRALEIYNGLALPQWNPIDRAAALIALRQRYLDAERADDAARIDPKLAELGLEMAQLQRAAAFVQGVEN